MSSFFKLPKIRLLSLIANKRKASSWIDCLSKKKNPLKGDECADLQKELNRLRPNVCDVEEQVIKTDGGTYILQTDVLPSENCELTNEDKNVKIMEAHLDQKDNVIDPLPNFTTVEQRMIDLSNKKLHPYYRRYLNIPKKNSRLALPEKQTYKSRSGPINTDELPLQLNINKRLLEAKNMFSEYKRIEPPRQLLSKLIEMCQNDRPTMQRRVPVEPSDSQDVGKNKNIFDTLYQKEQKF